MFDGKLKAVTFSYDDGVKQDVRLIELLNKYGLKCTFNLNSELLGKRETKVTSECVREIYEGHEVAVHTLTHPNLCSLEGLEVIRQVEQDRINLEELVGYPVRGLAYPGGSVDKRVSDIIRNHTKIEYCRTVVNTDSFDLQGDLYNFKPNVYHIMEPERLFHIAERFLNVVSEKPQILYVWGHAYEMDRTDTWNMLEDFFRLISGHSDIFYGTNAEVLLGGDK